MRLRSVKFKDGRAPVHIIHNRNDEASGVLAGIERGARILSELSTERSALDGYLIIGMYADGSTSLGYSIPDRIPRCLLTGYISEVVRRDVITGNEAETVFDSKFEWVE